MSYEDDLKKFLKEQDNFEPEDYFGLVAIMPKRKVKVEAYLEDSDGERIPLKDVAKQVLEYIDKNMKDAENNTPVNSQIFPLASSFATSVIPRAAAIEAAELIFMAPALRYPIIKYGMANFLLAQFIRQHNLKIVTETTKLTEKELQEYLDRSKVAEQRLAQAFGDTDGNSGDSGVN